METFEITKQDNRFDPRPLLNYLADAKNGTYRVEITRVRGKRSNDQNAWLWGCIYPSLRAGLNAQGWEFTDDEQVHEFCKQHFADNKVVNRDTGEVVTLPNSTKKMDTAQFSAYCEQLRSFAAEYLGVTIPDPITQ